MLRFLSGRKRSRNALLIFFVGLLTISLIGFFSGGPGAILGSSKADSASVAKIGDYTVTVKDMRDALSRFSSMISQGQGRIGGQSVGDTYMQYGTQVLDSLIRDRLVLHETDRLNLGATDSEVQARLKRLFTPWPGYERYRDTLAQQGMLPVQFEDNLRATIAMEHLRSYITAAVRVSEEEIKDDFRRNNTEYSVRWVEVNPTSFNDKVQVTEPDLRSYFEQNKAQFHISSEQRRARYIYIDREKAAETIQIPDAEMQQGFDPERYVRQVRVSQIVLNVPKEDPNADKNAPSKEEGIRTRAQQLADRARGSEGKPAEEFASLAREASEDPRTKASGGDLGWVNKQDKRESDDPLNNVFTMKEGEVSQPIKRGDKYYVLKVTERRLPAFADVRDEIAREARRTTSYSKAIEIATKAQELFKQNNDAGATAAEINRQYNAEVATVRETPFFVEGDSLPDIGAASEFQDAVFALQNINEVTNYIGIDVGAETDRGFAIAQFIEKRDPHDPTFEEVRAKVEEKYRADKAKELAAARARELGLAKTPDELRQRAAAVGLAMEERNGLSGNDSIGPLVSEGSRAPIYSLEPNQVTSEPIKADSSDSYVVAALTSRKDPDWGDKYQKERASIEQRLLDEKRNMYFETYLAQTREEMKREGEIEIYAEVLDENFGAASPDALQSPMQNPLQSPLQPGSPMSPATPNRLPQRRTPPVIPQQPPANQ
jgi:peptidyl-prolyl cis-trans isomerase D